MKILFSSYAFLPGVGGIETVSAILADEFVKAGHEVELITETPGENSERVGYRITRRPSLSRVISLLRWSDLFFQNNISLPALLLALVLRKPCIVVHQTWIRNARGELRWKDRLKRSLLSRVTNVAISQAVADDLQRSCVIIANPYRDTTFRIVPDVDRNRDLVFLGRLVSDKGADILLRALHHLRQNDSAPTLTIIGTGPEEQALRALSAELNLREQVEFVGGKSGNALATLLNQHRIMVIPSRWAEPFGVVALEGIACGCAVVGSEEGGLKEAMGPCGITFKNGDYLSLASVLDRLLAGRGLEESLRNAGPAHLFRFKPNAVTGAYLELIKNVVR
ncbi:MAG TPA: glycosyltransferase family 4 protein [Gemmatimonadaceae bacterium]|nr:glycosyltransferase family 4 protein [Gemmatimonadaceae bacterium]